MGAEAKPPYQILMPESGSVRPPEITSGYAEDIGGDDATTVKAAKAMKSKSPARLRLLES